MNNHYTYCFELSLHAKAAHHQTALWQVEQAYNAFRRGEMAKGYQTLRSANRLLGFRINPNVL